MPVITTEQLLPGDNITATLYSAVNGAGQINGKVLGVVHSQGVPPTSTAPTDHVNVYRDMSPIVQATIEDDWRSYNYIMLENADGGIVYIGTPWIVSGSLLRSDTRTATLILENFPDVDIENVRSLLAANGYVVSDWTLA